MYLRQGHVTEESIDMNLEGMITVPPKIGNGLFLTVYLQIHTLDCASNFYS